MSVIEEFSTAIEQHLGSLARPIAIKLLKQEDPMPVHAGRPLRDLGRPVRPCEAWHFVPDQNLSVVMQQEDFSTDCPAALFIFGILEPIKPWIEGDLAYHIYTDSREAAANMERNVFRLKAGEYSGVAFAPLGNLEFDPDLLMIYCNASQAQRLITSAAWKTGVPLHVTVAGRALCSDGIVQPLQKEEPVVAIPCAGDRLWGGAQDDDVVFTAPVHKLEEIAHGLDLYDRTHRAEHLGAESILRRTYNRMARMLDQQLGRARQRESS